MTDNSNTRNPVKVDIKKWEQKLGREILVKIIRILVGLNRIYALWNLMTQTAISEEEKNKARSFRNRSVSYVLTSGILHEVIPILGSLLGEMKEKSKNISEKIKEIIQICDQPLLRNTLTEFRHKVAFHLDEDVVDTGLNLTKDNVVDFINSDSDTYRDTYYKFAEDVSMYGFFGIVKEKLDGLQDDDFEKFYKEKLEEFMHYSVEIQEIFVKRVNELLADMIDEFQLQAEPVE